MTPETAEQPGVIAPPQDGPVGTPLATWVARAAVLATLLVGAAKWIPGDPDGWFGAGLPWKALEIDSELAARQPGDERLVYAFGGGIEGGEEFWTAALEAVNEIHELADPGEIVHIRGVNRDPFWRIVYLLYPTPFVGTHWEDGSRANEPHPPEATWLISLWGTLKWRRIQQ